MKRWARFLFFLLLIIIAVYFAKQAVLKGPDSLNISDTSGGDASDMMKEEVRSFSISGYSESGEKAWQIEGKTADIMTDVVNLSDITGNSYGKDVMVNLTSDKGVIDRATNNIRLKSNVVITTNEGTKLTTDTMDWDAKEQLVSTKDIVFIERKDMDAKGTGACANPNLKIAQLDKNVRVDTKDPPAVITCDGPLEIDYNNNVAYFYKNVKLDDGKVQIDTDKATAYFDPKQRSLSKVFCEGNVFITRGEDTTKADSLTYLPQEGRVLLEGRPKIVIRSGEDLIDKAKKTQDGKKDKSEETRENK